jgi:hypothetical protein
MSRTRTQIDETLVAYFTTAPLDEASRLLRLAGSIIKARQPNTAAPRKRRAKDQASLPLVEAATK